MSPSFSQACPQTHTRLSQVSVKANTVKPPPKAPGHLASQTHTLTHTHARAHNTQTFPPFLTLQHTARALCFALSLSLCLSESLCLSLSLSVCLYLTHTQVRHCSLTIDLCLHSLALPLSELLSLSPSLLLSYINSLHTQKPEIHQCTHTHTHTHRQHTHTQTTHTHRQHTHTHTNTISGGAAAQRTRYEQG